jgi:hypothetical protein
MAVAGTFGCLADSAWAALPEGRAYEMVSPPYKNGAAVLRALVVAADGEGVAFDSIGAFAGSPSSFGFNRYFARRGDDGWSISALDPPAALSAAGNLKDFTPNMTESLVEVLFAQNSGQGALATTTADYVHVPGTPDTSEQFALASPLLKTLSGAPVGVSISGASRDFSDVILWSTGAGPETELLPADTLVGHTPFYEVARANGPSPVLRLVTVNNKGSVINPSCEVELGGGSAGGAFNAISADGSEIFFTTEANLAATGCQENKELFVRINGSKTLEVSKSLLAPETCTEVPCPGAEGRAGAVFWGASEDGSKVVFTTAAPLVTEDTNASNDLYMASIEGETVKELVQVSHAPNPAEVADVQGVVSVSADGSHVYFVAHGVLAGKNAERHAPMSGAENLYVYDSSTRRTAFVGDLSERDFALWNAGGVPREAQSTGDGSYLVFSSYAQMTPDDTDTARDVYRYDAPTGSLVRVSVGEVGHDDNGNNSAFDASIDPTGFKGSVTEQYEMSDRAISEDGSRIVFTTAEPLSPDAVNGQPDIYIWHEGQIGMISSGFSPEADAEPVITPSGRDVFFKTAQGLVPQDTDGVRDVYDARIGGGFPPPPAPPAACSADACQGPLSSPPAPLLPGSAGQAAGGNLSAPTVTTKASTKARVKKKTKRKAKKKKAGRVNTRSGGRRR